MNPENITECDTPEFDILDDGQYSKLTKLLRAIVADMASINKTMEGLDSDLGEIVDDLNKLD